MEVRPPHRCKWSLDIGVCWVNSDRAGVRMDIAANKLKEYEETRKKRGGKIDSGQRK